MDADSVDKVLSLFPDITFEDARHYAVEAAYDSSNDDQQPDWFAEFATRKDKKYKDSVHKIIM